MDFTHKPLLRQSLLRVYGLFHGSVALCLIVSFSNFSQQFLHAQELSTLIEGLLARKEALVSGRLEYTYLFGPVDGNTLTTQHKSVYSFVFSGKSWRLKYFLRQTVGDFTATLAATYLFHDGVFVDYAETSQPNGKVRRTAQISSSPDRDLHRPPVFAGSFWWDNATYIEKHRARVRAVGTATIEGVATHVLELSVPKEERFQGFIAINDRLQEGGTLRLYVAPTLGYALPRIEYVAPNGFVAEWFHSEQFQQVAPGIFFPKICHWQHIMLDGGGWFERYEISSLTDVNESIPEEEFVLRLPLGTQVSDYREPTPRFYDITEAINEPPKEPTQPPVSQPRSWRGVYLFLFLAVNVALLALVACILAFRWRKR